MAPNSHTQPCVFRPHLCGSPHFSTLSNTSPDDAGEFLSSSGLHLPISFPSLSAPVLHSPSPIAEMRARPMTTLSPLPSSSCPHTHRWITLCTHTSIQMKASVSISFSTVPHTQEFWKPCDANAAPKMVGWPCFASLVVGCVGRGVLHCWNTDSDNERAFHFVFTHRLDFMSS